MRIWDLPAKQLCRKHLLGEHRELHAIWSIYINGLLGYRNHPETKRWAGKLKALFARHEELVIEMTKRGYNHNSPLDKSLAKGSNIQNQLINSKQEQRIILQQKPCSCFVK
jgi:Skp family chaperone for outer membrane proteins